jgi:hypothetical protein
VAAVPIASHTHKKKTLNFRPGVAAVPIASHTHTHTHTHTKDAKL